MRQLQLALSRYQRMNQLSLNLVSDDLPDYVIDDPIEQLEIEYPREALLWLLEQQYGPQVKLERTKDNRVNGVLYKCPCPVHHNDGETRGRSISINVYESIVRVARRPEPFPNCWRIAKLIQQTYSNTFCKTWINYSNILSCSIPISKRS